MDEASLKKRIRLLMAAQAGYYLVTGLWPLLSAESFQHVTGRKREMWLVKTTGILIGVAGTVLGLGAWRQRLTPEIMLIGSGTAAALGGSGMLYGLKGRVRRVYMLEGLVELVFVAAWGLFARKIMNVKPR